MQILGKASEVFALVVLRLLLLGGVLAGSVCFVAFNEPMAFASFVNGVPEYLSAQYSYSYTTPGYESNQGYSTPIYTMPLRSAHSWPFDPFYRSHHRLPTARSA